MTRARDLADGTFANDLTVDTNTLYVDSTNNRVGIGVGSPAHPLSVENPDGNTNTISMINNSSNLSRLAFVQNGSTTAAYSSIDADGRSTGFIRFNTNDAEAMRINSSGNLLVGGTSLGENGAVTMAGDGRIYAIRASDTAGFFGRTTTDGSIVNFTKDGSTVGSIGSRGAGTSYIILKSSAGAGAGLTGSDNAILPMDESALADANTSLGTGSYRFKDLYLSGNANVGDLIGPASANFDIKTGSGTGDMIFYTNGSERARIDASGNVGIGTSAPAHLVDAINTAGSATARFGSTYNIGANDGTVIIGNGGSGDAMLRFDYEGTNTDRARIGVTSSGQQLEFYTAGDNERMRIDSSGRLLVGKTTASSTGTGHLLHPNSASFAGRDNGIVYAYNRNGTDGGVIQIMNNDVVEGTISVSGTTVTYGGGHLARWSRLPDDSKDASIVKGTVMTNLDAMVEWGDEDNEQLNKTAVSSVEGDVNVAGVFVSWDDDDEWNDFYVAMTGDMIIRIASGTTVARGDLLMSAGDGTAKPQGDDIVRSKTIAKVTSTNVSHTYDDGSYCVPCVLMAC